MISAIRISRRDEEGGKGKSTLFVAGESADQGGPSPFTECVYTKERVPGRRKGGQQSLARRGGKEILWRKGILEKRV